MNCSFCEAPATTHVEDENDIMPACSACADAWSKDPGFHRTTPTPEQSSLQLKGQSESIVERLRIDALAIDLLLTKAGGPTPPEPEAMRQAATLIEKLGEALGDIHAARLRRDGTDPGYGWNITHLNKAMDRALPLLEAISGEGVR